MSTSKTKNTLSENTLFDRVVSILGQARDNVVRAVNTNMVMAYWLIGREIVQEIQGGENRAEYGKQVLEQLAFKLNQRYGSGFSIANVRNFRQFYLIYQNRGDAIRYLPGSESKLPTTHQAGGELPKHYPMGSEFTQNTSKSLQDPLSLVFSPQLSWSHYRALMRVDNSEARDFYESEAIECGWSKIQLERQIHSFYYDRIITNQGKKGLLPQGREQLSGERIDPASIIKSPLVLEFLGLPDPPELHESKLEQAIINNLQNFLLELGKGFSFVARQKHIRFDDEDFYIDLVFYNYILKCFLLIDFKMGKLKHADIGQMDGYVRLYEDQFKIPGDNPTIGLILCSDKSEAVAKYSILNENKQIFASKYMLCLPTEEQLQHEIERERRLIEEVMSERKEIGGGE